MVGRGTWKTHFKMLPRSSPPSCLPVETCPPSALGQLTFSRGQALTPDCPASYSQLCRPPDGRLQGGQHLNWRRGDIWVLRAQVPPWPAGSATRLLLTSVLRTPHQGEAGEGGPPSQNERVGGDGP